MKKIIHDFISFNNEKINYINNSNSDDIPIGIDNMVDSIYGLVFIYSSLDIDMVKEWNSDKFIQKMVRDNRLFLKEIKHNSWSIWGLEGDNEVKDYILMNYSW